MFNKVISILGTLILLVLVGCRDVAPISVEEPSTENRTITLNLDITTRANYLLPDNSEPDIIRLWICDMNDKIITSIVSSHNVWTPVGKTDEEGNEIDIRTTLQTEIEADDINEESTFKIYLVLNQPFENSTTPVDFMNVTSIDELKQKTFVLTEYGGDNKVPMTGEGTAKFSSVEGNKIIFSTSINAKRCVAKLGIYCTKSTQNGFLAIQEIRLGQEPDEGYLFETNANDISYNKSRILIQGFIFVEDFLSGKDLPSDNELEKYEEDFTNINNIELPYLLENVNGGEKLQVENVNETITDSNSRYFITLKYTFDGNTYIESKIYLSKIERNTFYKIFIRMKSPLDTDISYVVQPWNEYIVEVPEFN